MSRISKQIRAYVDDPESTGRFHYGAWGALRPDQRRLIRQLCDECDAFEKDADEFYRKASDVAREIFEEIEELMQEVMNENADLIRKRNTIIFGKKDPDSFIWAYNGRIDGMHQLRAKMTDLKKKYESEGADDE